MATRNETRSEVKGFGEYANMIVWEGLLNGDDGTPIECPGHSVRSVQFVGTFGVGGTIVMEGSNDGTNYVTLTDPQGTAISKTSASVETLQELTRYVRPRVTGGDVTTNLKAYLLIKRVK